MLLSCDKIELRGFFVSYDYVNERFQQSVKWNQDNGFKKVSVNKDEYSVFCMGDSHLGTADNLRKLFMDASNNKASAILLAGDITTGISEDYLTLETILPPKDSLNIFSVVGNHDLYFDGWKSFYKIFGSSSYYFEIHTPDAKDLFIGLDTGGGTLGKLQLKWLKDLLKARRTNYRYCTVFTHNNIVRLRPTMSTNPMSEEVAEILDLCLRYNISIFITGHDHVRNTAKFGNTEHIIMDALLDSNSEATYLKVDFMEDEFTYEFVPCN